MTKYVLGFLFSSDKRQVVLIEKQKPEWQKGMLNGVGGKVENNETPIDAMIREFKEETGVEITDWKDFGTLRGGNIDDGNDWLVFLFKAFGDVDRVKTMENEIVYTIPTSDIRVFKVIPNLQWLIPMALDLDDVFSVTTYQ